jgi:hypothetical protein
MKIIVSGPSHGEARILPATAGEMAIQPIFTGPRDRKTVFYLTVASDTGRERRFTLDVHGSTGRLQLMEVKETVAAFDQEDTREEVDDTPLSIEEERQALLKEAQLRGDS